MQLLMRAIEFLMFPSALAAALVRAPNALPSDVFSPPDPRSAFRFDRCPRIVVVDRPNPVAATAAPELIFDPNPTASALDACTRAARTCLRQSFR